MSAETRHWPRRLVRRLRALFRPGAVDRDLDEEMRHHLELEAEEIARASGVPEEEARRRALVAFGGVSRYQEEHRDARGILWLEQTLQDLRHAARGLRRSPAFTLSAVGVLALGIGSTTAVFSAVNAVLRNPNHDTIAVLFYRGFPSFSTVDYRAVEAQQRSFTAVGAFRGGEAAFRVQGEPERVRTGRVTAGYFRVLGVRPLAGRLIEPRDEPVGAEKVAVVSHALATRALGGPASAVGRTVAVDGVGHTVVGVLPPESEVLAAGADVWPALQLEEPERRGPFGMLVLARLKPTATFEGATRDVTGISERIFPLWATGLPDRAARFEAIPVRTAFLANPSRMLRIFGAGVALVLLIGVANVASLMLVRAIGRSQEVSVRAVLGASRGQLVRLFVTESALLVAAGAAVGVAAGALGLRMLIAYGPQMPGLTPASLDTSAVLFAAGVAVCAGLAVGTYPVLMLLRRGPTALSGTRTIGGRHAGRIRSGFVVAQFAFALPLLAVAGLLLVSFERMQRVDPGFDPSHLLTVQVSLPSGQYEQGAPTRAYWTQALARVRELPGVVEAGLSSTMAPDDFGSSNDNFNLIDKPAPPGTAEPNGPWPFADSEYFAALGVPLLEGRLFTPADTAGAPPAVVVSRAWANKYYPGQSPLGKTMVRGGCTECIPSTVVGVVGDVRYSGLAGPLDALYTPVSEVWPRSLFMYVRTAGSPGELMEPVREALRSVDPTVPLDDVTTMEQRLHTSMAQPRQWASLLGGFAAAALGLAAVGVFGMLSYMVGTRRREIGVRMALGAGPRSIMQMVVGNGLVHALAGSLLGLAAALAGTRALTAALFDVSPGDPGTLALATLALLAVALLACWIPARRAAGIPPLEAIRHE